MQNTGLEDYLDYLQRGGDAKAFKEFRRLDDLGELEGDRDLVYIPNDNDVWYYSNIKLNGKVFGHGRDCVQRVKFDSSHLLGYSVSKKRQIFIGQNIQEILVKSSEVDRGTYYLII